MSSERDKKLVVLCAKVRDIMVLLETMACKSLGWRQAVLTTGPAAHCHSPGFTHGGGSTGSEVATAARGLFDGQ